LKRLLISLALLLGLSIPVAADTCTSNMAAGVVGAFSTAGTWTGCAAAPPNTAAENFIIPVGQMISVGTDAVVVGTGLINGTLFWAEDMTAGVDGDGWRTLTITPTGANTGIEIGATGTLQMRHQAALAFDTTAGIGRISVDNTGIIDIQGSVFETTISAITEGDATDPACGTTPTGRLWTITPTDGMEWVKAHRRIRFHDGTARNRQFEIKSATATAFVLCTNLPDGDSQGNNLTPHKTVGVFPTLRHNIPDYEPNASCAGANDPFDCCSGAGAGSCDSATIVPAVGDTIQIINEAWVYQKTGTAGVRIDQESAGAAMAAMPTFYAVNFSGLGATGAVSSIRFDTDTAGLAGVEFAYNNFHDYNGVGISFRGFTNYEIHSNVCHDSDTNATDSGGCIQILATLSAADGGSSVVTSAVDGVVIRDNDLYHIRGNAIQFNSIGAITYATGAVFKNNLVREGCTTADAECGGIEIDACVACSITGNVVYDICRTEVTSGRGIQIASSATATVPAALGADNINAGSYTANNWIVNVCGTGISSTAGGTLNDSAQQTYHVGNYIAHTREDGIEGGNVYGNVIANFGMAGTNAGRGLDNPILAKGNFILGGDETLYGIGCNCAAQCINYNDAAGNFNGTNVTASDNICVGQSAGAARNSIDINAGTDFNVDVEHYTLDALERTESHLGLRNNSTETQIHLWTNFVITHTDEGIGIRGSGNGTVRETCGPMYMNRSATATESTNSSTTITCDQILDTLNTITQVGGIGYLDRVNRDYNFAAGAPGLTAALDGSPIGIRAFRFDRDRIDDRWGDILPYIIPFPKNIANVDNIDTDGDLIIDLHDNCDYTVNPAQVDADADGKGCACDSDEAC